jgi:hypothetical protein
VSSTAMKGRARIALELLETIKQGTVDEAAEASAELGRLIVEDAWLAVFASPDSLYASAPGIDVDLAAGNVGAPFLHNFQQSD